MYIYAEYCEKCKCNNVLMWHQYNYVFFIDSILTNKTNTEYCIPDCFIPHMLKCLPASISLYIYVFSVLLKKEVFLKMIDTYKGKYHTQ